MPKVSIIVPIYGVEKYLDKCVRSLTEQTLKDIEIILVDDGSPDDCPAMCDRYAAQDERIKVIHQQNAGVSAARNAGMDVATGEYVGFVDSDDWVEADMYRCMYEAAGGADAVSSYPFTHFTDGSVVKMRCSYLNGNATINREDWDEKYISFFAGSVWNFLYSRKLLQEHHVQFVQGLKRSEDRIFNLEALSYARQTVYVDRPLYHYFIRVGSATQRYVADMWKTVLLTDAKTQEVLTACWNGEFSKWYRRDVIIGGAILTIYSICSFANPASRREKVENIRQICQSKELKEAFSLCGINGTPERWMTAGAVGKLYRYGRCYAAAKELYDRKASGLGVVRLVAQLRHGIIFRSK